MPERSMGMLSKKEASSAVAARLGRSWKEANGMTSDGRDRE